MAKKDFIENIIHKYCLGTCTEEEKMLIESWHLKELAESKYLPTKEQIELANKRTQIALSAGKPTLSHIHTNKRKLWPSFALTASIFVLISIGIFTYLRQPKPKYTKEASLIQNDVTPGGNKATLTLNNGLKIALDKAKNGLLSTQVDLKIRKEDDARITYKNSSGQTSAAVSNRLETPKGGKYEVILPDGTKIWLNSSSAINYDIPFRNNQRKVYLTGEAYFEVAKIKGSPFKVYSNQQIVEVLGTHFNISAYPDEKKTKTTLLEGSIKIVKGTTKIIVRPGQSASTEKISDKISIEKADLEKEMAWKNNEFIFDGEDLESIMKIISRWYDVQVIYQNDLNQAKYWGVVSRSKNISAVLKMLQSTGNVSFKVQGRRVTVMN